MSESLDSTLSEIVAKAAGALEQAATQYGPDAVELALAVGRIAAIKEILLGILVSIAALVSAWLTKKGAQWAWKQPEEEWQVSPIPTFAIIGPGVSAVALFLIAMDKLLQIHAWVGIFRPEIYLAYEAIF